MGDLHIKILRERIGDFFRQMPVVGNEQDVAARQLSGFLGRTGMNMIRDVSKKTLEVHLEACLHLLKSRDGIDEVRRCSLCNVDRVDKGGAVVPGEPSSAERAATRCI